MSKWYPGVALASMLILLSAQLQVGARPMAGNGSSANAPAATTTTVTATATAVPLQQTCSCGIASCDGMGSCIFHCNGPVSACISCGFGCCRGEFQRICGLQP